MTGHESEEFDDRVRDFLRRKLRVSVEVKPKWEYGCTMQVVIKLGVARDGMTDVDWIDESAADLPHEG